MYLSTVYVMWQYVLIMLRVTSQEVTVCILKPFCMQQTIKERFWEHLTGRDCRAIQPHSRGVKYPAKSSADARVLAWLVSPVASLAQQSSSWKTICSGAHISQSGVAC